MDLLQKGVDVFHMIFAPASSSESSSTAAPATASSAPPALALSLSSAPAPLPNLVATDAKTGEPLLDIARREAMAAVTAKAVGLGDRASWVPPSHSHSSVVVTAGFGVGTTPIRTTPERTAAPLRTGASDPSFQRLLTTPDSGKGNFGVCFRCKRDCCPGVRDCKFDSNAFYALKETKCSACGIVVKKGVDLITKMTRGQFEGLYLHQECASRWYDAFPKGSEREVTPLMFHKPSPEVAEVLDLFAAGTIFKVEINSIAGSGKSNAIVYTAAQLRKAGRTFVILVFNVLARNSLIARGLRPHEVYTFHSFGIRAYRRWVTINLGEQAEMLERADKEGRFQPEVCPAKMRLIVGFHLRDHPQGRMLTALLRPFVAELARQARVHGFGTPDGPMFFDKPALAELVAKYNIDSKLEGMWSSGMKQPEKLAIDRAIGPGTVARLHFAIDVTAHALELSFQFATQLEVDGARGLMNEVRGEAVAAPNIDQQDMTHIPASLALSGGQYDCVMLDEGQDTDMPQMCIAQASLKPNGGLLCVKDKSQAAYLYGGIELAEQEKMMHGARIVTLNRNYRSGRAINSRAQEVLNAMGRNVQIISMRDLEGEVLTDTPFYVAPISLKHSTLVVGRATRQLLVFYKVLLELGYPVVMHGQPDTVAQLLSCLHEHDATLARVKAQLEVAVATQFAVTSASVLTADAYELKSALLGCLQLFLETSPVDPTLPESKSAFAAWLKSFFSEGDAQGVVRVTTAHAGKGLEADHVYLVNPDSFPLEERIQRGGWEEYEEWCVAYVAVTRARDRLIELPNLDKTSRAAVLELFQKPVAAAASIGPAATPAAEPTQSSQDTDDTVAVDTDAALARLGLERIPSTVVELNDVVRGILRRQHPDSGGRAGSSSTSAASASFSIDANAVLHARNHLKAVLNGAAS